MDKITAFAMGFAFRLGQIAYAARHGMAMDEDKWITIHPNGKGVNEEGEKITGRAVLINEETGMVRAGFGKGKHISQIGNKNKPAAPAISNANNVSNTSLQKEIASLQKQKAALQDDLKKAQADLSDQHTAALQQQLNNALEQAGQSPLDDLFKTTPFAIVPGKTKVGKIGNLRFNDEYAVIKSNNVFQEPNEGEFVLYNKRKPKPMLHIDHVRRKMSLGIYKGPYDYQYGEIKNLDDVKLDKYTLNGVVERENSVTNEVSQYAFLKNKDNGEFVAIEFARIKPDGSVANLDPDAALMDYFGILNAEVSKNWDFAVPKTKSAKKPVLKSNKSPSTGTYDFSAVWTDKLVKKNAHNWSKFVNATDTSRLAHVQDMMDDSQKQRLENAAPDQRQNVLNQIYDEIGNRAPKLSHSQLNSMNLSDYKKNFMDNVHYFGESKKAYYPVNPSLNTGTPLQFIQQQLGNNTAPTLVGKAEYHAMKKDKKNFVTIYRGVQPIPSMSTEELMKNLKEGKQTWLGDGIFGDGLYFSDQRSSCSWYANRDKDIQEVLLDKSKAKIIDYNVLFSQATPEEREFISSIPNNGKKGKDGNWSLLALKKGYNVIKVPQPNNEYYYIPLDRSALVFEK